MKNHLPATPIFAAIALMIAQTAAPAATILADNPAAPVVSNTIAPSGDFLFDASPVGDSTSSADVSNLPAYATVAQENRVYPPEFFTAPLSVNGTSYDTGVAYPNAGTESFDPTTGLPTPEVGAAKFITFELGTSTPAAFEVGLLSNYPDVTYYTLDLYSGDPTAGGSLLASSLLDPAQIKNENDTGTSIYISNNEFYYATVTGATNGDYLVVEGQSSNSGAQVTLGAVTFDSVVPEPSTYLLVSVGAAMLLLSFRLRSGKTS